MKYITETRRMNLKDFTIRDSFLKTIPSEKKMEKCRNYFKENGVLDREIIIHNGVLVDGYVGYLVLRENGVEEWDIEVVTSTVPLKTYVYGKHTPNGREFVWLAIKKIAKEVKKGDGVCVNTSRGSKVVTVTRVERRYEPPTELPIKTAYRIFGRANHKSTIELQSGMVFSFKNLYGETVRLGDLICGNTMRVVNIFYAPKSWWQFWKKRTQIGYTAVVI